jgi:signal transduction histidine kinase
MTAHSLRQILVIGSDYELLQRVQSALEDTIYQIKGAFSYHDALYHLEHETPHLAVVDATLADGATGTPILQTLVQQTNVPLIVFSLQALNPEWIQPPVEMVIASLDERTLRNSVAALLSRGDRQIPDSADEIQTLFALSKSLTEVLDLTEVLNRVVEAARSLTGAEEGMILLPDDEAGRLYLRARVGIDDEVARNFRIKTEDSLAGQVYSSGEPVLINAQRPQKVKTKYFVNALLYVPILLKGTCIGVLGVSNKAAQYDFEPRHQELLLNLASYAAVAIENARIHQEALERSRELQSLVDASEVVNASVALFETLPNICKQLVKVLNVGWSAILEWRPETSQLRVLAQYQNILWRSGHGPVLTVDRRYFEDDVIRLERAEAGELLPVGVQTMLAVPVRSENQMLGLIRAFYTEPLGRLPGPKAVQRVGYQGLEALMALRGTVGPAAMAHILKLVASINQLIGSNWCELALLSPDGRQLHVQATVGAGVWLKKPYPTIDLRQYPDLQTIVEQQLVINHQMNNMGLGLGVRMFMESTRSHALLGLPLVQRGQVTGLVLFGDNRYARVFSERDIHLGRAIVGQAATALENARLVHDLEFSLQELKGAQERLIQAARLSAMGELSAAVAHQINNPLTTILVDTELMLLDEPQDSRNYRSLQAIARAGKRAASVVRRLLATARPIEENAQLEPIDVVDSIEGILSLVRPHIEQDQIQVRLLAPGRSIPPVWALQGQLEDIWLNLLLNAHDALVGRGDGEIWIEVRYQPGDAYIQVEVCDNGPGIPAHLQTEIFKPFFTTKSAEEGTGLGLHICSQVVERIQGDISVQSTEGQGTRFLVRLPVKKGNE